MEERLSPIAFEIGQLARGSPFETADIDTMRALVSVRGPDTSMTLAAACPFSAASVPPSIFTGQVAHSSRAVPFIATFRDERDLALRLDFRDREY